MNKPILDAEEVQALLTAVAPEEHTTALLATLPPLAQPEKVDDFTFGENQSVGPDQYPMFSNMHDRLPEVLTERWGSIFHRDVPVFFKELVEKSYIDLLDSDDPRVYFTLECAGLGTMLLVLDMALVVSYIDAILGGTGEITPDETSVLTPLEMRLAERIAESTGVLLSKLWEPIRSMKFKLRRIDMDPMSLALTAEDVPCFSMTNVIVLGEEARGDFSLHYPIPFLEPMLMDMRKQVREQTGTYDEQWVKDLRNAIEQTPLELRLELARCRLRVRDFLHMKPGDFLPLSLSEQEPAKVWVEGFPLFLANPGQQQGMLAAEITEDIFNGGNT